MPIRFSMYVSLAVALVAALWLSAARRGWDRVLRFTLAALACLCLAPNPARFQWTPLPLESFFEPQNVIAFLGQGANVIILPYNDTGPSLIWQWQSGMAFSQSGGYVGFTPPSEGNWPVLQKLSAGTGGPSFDNDISAFCATHDVSAILVAPGTPAPMAAAVDGLHWQETTDHGVRVVHVPNQWSLHFHYVLGDFMPFFVDSPESWMGNQVKIVTHGQPMQLRISGRYRPSELGPVEIRVVANGSDVSRYQIDQQDIVLSLPADGSCILTASATFDLARIVHNGDQRPRSVTISLHPDSSGQQ